MPSKLNNKCRWITGTVLLISLTINGCALQPSKSQPADPVVSRTWINLDAPYPQSHASTIAQAADGSMVAAWFGGLHERHANVKIYVARYIDRQWTQVAAIDQSLDKQGRQVPLWNPVLMQPPEGNLRLFYKAGPNPREWWGLVTESPDGGKTWSEPKRLPSGILGPSKNKPIATAMGSWLIPASEETDNGWSLHFESSIDEGLTWQPTASPENPLHIDAIQASLLTYANGSLQAIARTKQGVLASTWSWDRGKHWSPLAALPLPNPNSGTDAVTLADGRQLLVYNHSAHNPETPGKGPRYPLNIALSDDGIHWENVYTLESNPIPEGYAYPAVIQSDDGKVHITYTVGRKRIRHLVIDPEMLVSRQESL